MHYKTLTIFKAINLNEPEWAPASGVGGEIKRVLVMKRQFVEFAYG